MPPKTSGFWISFRSISMRRKKVPQGISHGPALAAADVAGRESWRVCRSSDYQIAHLPPAAASAGAARWAAKFGRPAHRRAVRWSGSGDGGTSDSMRNLFVPWLESGKGNPKTTGFWRRFCILLPPRAKGCRAGARNIPAGGIKGTSSGPSRTPAPTGCVYLGAPVFGKPPIWAQQSHCTITDRRVSAWYAGAAAGMGVQAIRCTVISIYFGFRGVHGGVL